MQLETIHFDANSSFVGTPRLDFEGHLSGLTYSLPWDFKDSAHRPTVKGEDDGARLVKSRGLAFVPCATADIKLEQGPRAPITKVLSCGFAGLRLQDRMFDPALDWTQASFTAQEDGTYTGHIHTRQEPQQVKFLTGYYRGNALLVHLRSAFPGHFLPEPSANADQK